MSFITQHVYSQLFAVCCTAGTTPESEGREKSQTVSLTLNQRSLNYSNLTDSGVQQHFRRGLQLTEELTSLTSVYYIIRLSQTHTYSCYQETQPSQLCYNMTLLLYSTLCRVIMCAQSRRPNRRRKRILYMP